MNQQQPTHATSRPNQGTALTLTTFKKELNDQYMKTVNNYFRGEKDKAMKFMSAVVRSVQTIPQLLECSKDSLMTAFMTCAEFELYPSNASGEAYVIPYKGKAQFQLGYQGIVTLAYRAGVEALTSNIVYEKDQFEYEEGLEPKLVHKPYLDGDRGKPRLVYAIGQVNGQKVFKVLVAGDVMKFKNLSQTKGSQYSPWNSGNDPELWMWRKTCIKQLGKLLPKNDAMQRAIAKDNAEDSILPQFQLDAGGPAVGKALHDPSAKPEAKAEKEPELPTINVDES